MKEFRLKGSEKILKIISNFSATEKFIFAFLTIIIFISAISLASKVNSLFLVSVPAHGGEFSEGIIGLPRTINPVLAFTDTDKDLTNLLYSGLMKYESGVLVPDLAESYKVSDDGLIYNFKLRSDLRFHDGTQITTDDVEFTIQKIQDSEIKSPKRADWASVSIKKINNIEIQFILKQPYAPFLSNTTIGIIPKNVWKNLTADQFIFNKNNLEPVGSGPYEINSIEKDNVGTPISYRLSSFNKFHTGEPYISDITIIFYQNEDEIINSFKNGTIDNFAGISPKRASELASTTKDLLIVNNPLPRIFGLFLNQNNSPVLVNKEVRQALNLAVDRKKIVDQVLYRYGVSIDGPLPFDSSEPTTIKGGNNIADKQTAKSILAKNGWSINSNGVMAKKVGGLQQTLEISIATADSEDLKQAAEIVKKDWEEIGAKVNVRVFEYGDLTQNIIKARKYDALLFGEIINKDLDLYAFWHSSQRNSPGLNVAMYVNSKVDSLLEEARTTYKQDQLEKINKSFEKIIKEDVPAVFLYSPDYIYVMSKNIKGYNIKSIANNSERFYGIDKWYIETDEVWKIFVNNNK
jgi:peptide/nickel transport system substrate-binding protein